jgi:hypothetical protein
MGLPLHASKNEESKDLARWRPQGLNQQQGMQGQALVEFSINWLINRN